MDQLVETRQPVVTDLSRAENVFSFLGKHKIDFTAGVEACLKKLKEREAGESSTKNGSNLEVKLLTNSSFEVTDQPEIQLIFDTVENSFETNENSMEKVRDELELFLEKNYVQNKAQFERVCQPAHTQQGTKLFSGTELVTNELQPVHRDLDVLMDFSDGKSSTHNPNSAKETTSLLAILARYSEHSFRSAQAAASFLVTENINFCREFGLTEKLGIWQYFDGLLWASNGNPAQRHLENEYVDFLQQEMYSSEYLVHSSAKINHPNANAQVVLHYLLSVKAYRELYPSRHDDYATLADNMLRFQEDYIAYEGWRFHSFGLIFYFLRSGLVPELIALLRSQTKATMVSDNVIQALTAIAENKPIPSSLRISLLDEFTALADSDTLISPWKTVCYKIFLGQSDDILSSNEEYTLPFCDSIQDFIWIKMLAFSVTDENQDTLAFPEIVDVGADHFGGDVAEPAFFYARLLILTGNISEAVLYLLQQVTLTKLHTSHLVLFLSLMNSNQAINRKTFNLDTQILPQSFLSIISLLWTYGSEVVATYIVGGLKSGIEKDVLSTCLAKVLSGSHAIKTLLDGSSDNEIGTSIYTNLSAVSRPNDERVGPRVTLASKGLLWKLFENTEDGKHILQGMLEAAASIYLQQSPLIAAQIYLRINTKQCTAYCIGDIVFPEMLQLLSGKIASDTFMENAMDEEVYSAKWVEIASFLSALPSTKTMLETQKMTCATSFFRFLDESDVTLVSGYFPYDSNRFAACVRLYYDLCQNEPLLRKAYGYVLDRLLAALSKDSRAVFLARFAEETDLLSQKNVDLVVKQKVTMV